MYNGLVINNQYNSSSASAGNYWIQNGSTITADNGLATGTSNTQLGGKVDFSSHRSTWNLNGRTGSHGVSGSKGTSGFSGGSYFNNTSSRKPAKRMMANNIKK